LVPSPLPCLLSATVSSLGTNRWTVKDLQSGATYEFRVRVRRGGQWSEFSPSYVDVDWGRHGISCLHGDTRTPPSVGPPSVVPALPPPVRASFSTTKCTPSPPPAPSCHAPSTVCITVSWTLASTASVNRYTVLCTSRSFFPFVFAALAAPFRPDTQ
jgi:hypothetical protein